MFLELEEGENMLSKIPHPHSRKISRTMIFMKYYADGGIS